MIIFKAVILVVEDDAIGALDISRSLSSFGYEVVGPASSGIEALEMVAKHNIDLILMDITLKGELDGIETAHKIREASYIPIIFLTAHSDEKTVQKAKIVEPLGYLIKPFDGIELRHTLEIALYKHKMEKELKESEKKFQMLFDRTPIPYQSLDENGFILDVNQAWLDVLGYSREEVVGHWFGDFLAPEYIDHFKINFPRFKEAGEVHAIEFEMICGNGSRIHVSYDGKIGYDGFGNFKQTHCVFQDISEQKKVEKELKESEEKLKAFDESKAFIAIYNDQGQVEFLNQQFIDVFGYSLDEISSIDEWWKKAYPDPEYRKKVIKDWSSSLEKLKLEKTDIGLQKYSVTCKDGTNRIIEFSATKLADKNFVLAFDVTNNCPFVE